MLPLLHSKAPQSVVSGLLPARLHKCLLGRAPSSQPAAPHPALLTSLEAPVPGLPTTRAPEHKAHDHKDLKNLRPVSTAAGAPSLSRQTQPLLKFSFSEPVANFCPFHHPHHTPSSGQPLSPLSLLNPVLNVGSISRPLIYSSIQREINCVPCTVQNKHLCSPGGSLWQQRVKKQITYVVCWREA